MVRIDLEARTVGMGAILAIVLNANGMNVAHGDHLSHGVKCTNA